MRRGRRDLGIALGRVETFLGNGRIVVEMDQVMRDAGMPRLALEDRLQNRRALELVGIGFVGGRRCDVECDGICDLRLIVLRIALRQRLHRFEIGQHARAMIDLVVVGVENQQCVDVVALALRASAERLALLQRSKAEREIFGWRWSMRIVEQAERDAPIGDGALGIGLQRLLEDFLRLAIPERVLIAHRAIEPPLRDLVARCVEVNCAELLVAAVLRESVWQENRGL